MVSFRRLWLFCLVVIAAAGGGASGGDVSYDGRSLIIDGQRKLLFSGSIHYPRSTPDVNSLSLSEFIFDFNWEVRFSCFTFSISLIVSPYWIINTYQYVYTLIIFFTLHVSFIYNIKHRIHLYPSFLHVFVYDNSCHFKFDDVTKA